MKRRTDALTGAALALIGLVTLIWIIPAQIEEAPEASISPSFVANLSMGALVGLSLLLMIKALLTGRSERGPVITGRALKWLAFVVLSLIVSGLLVQYFGFLYGGIPLVAGYMLYMGERRVKYLLPVVLGTTGFCFAVLKYLLKVV